MAQTIQLPLAAIFATPWFVWAGLGLAAVPIIIHILNRRRFRVVPWAAMEYLLQAMRKNRRRLRFEQWLLLALRCLVLALLGLALARPQGCADTSLAALAGQRTGLHVFVIDNSYSMAYEADRPGAKTHLDQAKILAKQRIDRLAPGREVVAIVTAGSPAAVVIGQPGYDLDAAKAAVDRIEQSYGGTDLQGAFQKALEIGREQSGQPRRILYILSDGTRSAWEGPSAEAVKQLGPQLARMYGEIHHANLGRAGQWNQATLDLKVEDHLLTTRFGAEFSSAVKGFGKTSEAFVEWKLDNQVLPGRGAVQVDSQTPRQMISQVRFRTGGPHVLTTSLVGNDRLKVDDVRYRVVHVASELKVLVVEGDHGVGLMSGSAAYLNLALAPPKDDAGGNGRAGEASGLRSDSYVQPEVISDLELGNKVLTEYRAVILTNVSQLSATQADQIQRFVQQGGTLMLFMGEQVNRQAYNDVLLPRHLMPGALVRPVSVGADQRGFQFDFKPNGLVHPMLSVFRGEEHSGLDTAQVFTYWQVELPTGAQVDRVLDYVPAAAQAAGQAKDPAITVHALGQGRVVFVSTTANADWTSLPAKPAYVTLVHELLAGSVSLDDAWMNVQVGQALQVPRALQATAAPSLTDASGRQVIVEQITDREGQTFYRSRLLTAPGVYTLATGQRTVPIAVNVPAADEADVRTIDEKAIPHALGDIGVMMEGDQLPPEPVVEQAGTDYGWSVMLLVLALVGAECFMAMRLGHYRK
jgi:hypothetical protein